jgi:amino acid adenylation domain-containing protein
MSVTDKLNRLTPEQRAALALRLSEAKRPDRGPKAAALPQLHPEPQNRYEPFPLSDIQQAYLIGRSEALELGSTGCHCYFEIEIEDWDRERFQTALRKLIQRHEMLRAIILPEGRQQILENVPPYEIKTQDLQGLDSSAAKAKLEAVRGEMEAYLHPTDRWPLFEFRASLLDARRARLHIGIDLLIADGRSFEIFFGELAQLYRDPATALPSLDLSFRDYVLAAEAFEYTDTFRQSQEYWLKRLPTLPPSPELPLAVSPASIVKPKFNRHRARIEAAKWRELKEKTTRTGLTAPAILLAAFAEVLSIWSKSAHFTLNLTLFNRLPLHPQANHIVGDFTSVNLLEIDNRKDEGFEARARKQQEQLWQDLNYRHFSGVRVTRELIRQQGVGPKATMPVVFTSLLNIGGSSEERTWAARLGEPVYSASQTPQVYLDLVTHEDRGALVVDWFVVDELFPPNLIEDLFKAFQILLQALVSDESAWTRTLAENTERLLPEYQARLFKEVNDTKAPISEEFLHTLFLKQVERRPKQLAVCTPNRRMTYAEVYSRACRIEEELLPRGLEPNQFVGIVMEKGWEQIVAVMGILFAGGAYMPIDPDLPPERQRYLIENGDVKVILTQSSVQQRVSAPHDVEVLVVDQMEPLEGRPTTAPRTRQKREDLAYIIYTSGSTGQPKGVIVDHCGAVNTILDINDRFGVGPQDRVLALSRLNFDLSVYDIFGLLAAGGTIVMPSPELAQDTTHWAQLVASEKVTIWDTVPALMGLLVEQAEHGESIGQSLRVVMMSGDWIPVGLPGQIRKLLPKATIMSLGGATEASIWSILYPIEKVDSKWKSIPYGKPMRNQTFHVLSRQQAPCPVWVPGELYIGGNGLARGYWRDAEKTGASFIHRKTTGERLYRTGDWGRYLPDGNIEFLGREDSQVKVQGYRIELGEIEAKLVEREGIDSCVVLVREDTPGERRLVGYIIPAPGADLKAVALREFLRAKLPEYMVPSAFVFLEAFPLTANGKLDRKALPAARAEIAAASETEAPRDILEVQLTRLWEKVLNVHPVKLRDNFFDLGGNSLMAVRLFSELRRLTGRTLALSTLFQAPTVEKLAALLRDHGWRPSWSSLVPIRAGGRKPPFFCVHGAGGNVLLFHDLARLLGPDYPFYGVQAHGMDGSRNYLKTVEEMANHYLKEIRELQPQGPYYLGGFCMGGQVAYEMAQILQKDGQQVAVLAMIDTYNFHGVPLRLSFGEQIAHAREKFGFHWGNFVRLGMKEELEYLNKKVKGALHREVERLHVRISNLFGISHQPTGGVAHDLLLERLNEDAHFAYVAATYPGKVTIFKPQRNYSFARDEKMGWGDFAPDLELRELPVDPGGIFVEPYVQTLAHGLRSLIDEAEAANRKEQKEQAAANKISADLPEDVSV